MNIVNILRAAQTEHEIYSLLTAYVDALRHFDKGAPIAEDLISLPITGKADLKNRSARLFVELDKASRRLDDDACETLREARAIFTTALHSLRAMEKNRRSSLSQTGMDSQFSWANLNGKRTASMMGQVATKSEPLLTHLPTHESARQNALADV